MSSLQIIEINHRSLSRDSASMQEELAKLQSQMQELSEEMRSLNGMWEGAASSGYQAQVAADIEKLEEVCLQVAQHIEKMEAAQAQYEICEDRVMEVITALRV